MIENNVYDILIF